MSDDVCEFRYDVLILHHLAGHDRSLGVYTVVSTTNGLGSCSNSSGDRKQSLEIFEYIKIDQESSFPY